MKLTKIQITTIVLFIAWGVWEFFVYDWAKTEDGPIIRADLVFILPILAIMLILSIVQLFRRKKSV
ncbi:hypothetical protein [Exiguobacterium algae]|uniref:hypothetical protein n=1 Tax=Exiguobacterium algae TaxID=2751250 RepID=UPI001BE6B04B|nr:hypothetical protein [Exiguobacterium algae]